MEKIIKKQIYNPQAKAEQTRVNYSDNVDNPRDETSLELLITSDFVPKQHPEVHTHHYRMELARKIWRNYKHD